ncbi:MAG: cupin [Candidatus Dactylopiibacterium sp.]|nr:cupin [Candidatus Dactylopiibacterium sp.]
MAIPHARSGDVIAVGLPLAPDARLEDLRSETLVRDTHIEVFRLVLQPGVRLQEHRASGLLTIQCLAGGIDLTAQGQHRKLAAGDLVHLRSDEPHAVVADTFSVLLLTLFLHRA